MRKVYTAIALCIAAGALAYIAFHDMKGGKTAVPDGASPVCAKTAGPETRGPGVSGEVARVRALIGQRPRDASLREELAVLLFANGRQEEALSQLQTAIDITPKDPWYHYRKAAFLVEMGKRPDALREARRAAELGRTCAQRKEASQLFSMLAGQLLNDSGAYGAAERQYEMALAQLSAFATDRRAMGMDRNGVVDRLRSEAEKGLAQARGHLVPSRPTSGWIQSQMPYVKGCVTRETAQARGCKDLERRVLCGEYGGESAHIELSNCYFKLGMYDKAAVQSLAATLVAPRGPMGWFGLGQAYLLDGRLASAAEAFDRAHRYGMEGADTLATAARRLSVSYSRSHPNVTPGNKPK